MPTASCSVKTAVKSLASACLARISDCPMPPAVNMPTKPVKIWIVAIMPKSAGTSSRASATPKANSNRRLPTLPKASHLTPLRMLWPRLIALRRRRRPVGRDEIRTTLWAYARPKSAGESSRSWR